MAKMQADYIWMNGEIIPWEQATVHVFTHALHYGSSAFEGIRAYEVDDAAAIFRGPEHFERLLFSCKVARIPSPLSVDEWMEVAKAVVKKNGHRSAYIRPLVFRGYETLGVDGRAVLWMPSWAAYRGGVIWAQSPLNRAWMCR